jgi:hypothetical protein
VRSTASALYQLSPFYAACPALILATAAAFDSFVLTST